MNLYIKVHEETMKKEVDKERQEAPVEREEGEGEKERGKEKLQMGPAVKQLPARAVKQLPARAVKQLPARAVKQLPATAVKQLPAKAMKAEAGGQAMARKAAMQRTPKTELPKRVSCNMRTMGESDKCQMTGPRKDRERYSIKG